MPASELRDLLRDYFLLWEAAKLFEKHEDNVSVAIERCGKCGGTRVVQLAHAGLSAVTQGNSLVPYACTPDQLGKPVLALEGLSSAI